LTAIPNNHVAAPHVSLYRRVVSLHAILILCAIYFLTSQKLDHFADDPGVGWHLATGAWIVEHGTAPQVDPFLALPAKLSSPRPWISDQWLGDLALYTGYQVGGWSLLYVAMSLIFVASFLLLPFFSLRQRSPPLALLAAALVAFKMGEIHFILRPVLFGIACFSLLLCWLAKHSERNLQRLSHAKIALIALLFCIWANLHPSFIMGFGVLGVWSLFNSRLGNVWLALVISMLATLVNPYGIRLHESIFALAGNDYFMQLNSEWRPLEIRSHEGAIFASSCLVLLLAQILRLFRGSQTPHDNWLFFLTCLFGMMTLRSVRILPFFGLIVILPLSHAIADLVGVIRLSALNLTRRFLSELSRHEQCSKAGAWCFALIGIGLLSVSLFDQRVIGYSGGLGPSPSRYPYAALDLLAERARFQDVVIVASPDYGGFITWFGSGARPVIDDRNTLLGATSYQSFFAALSAQPGDRSSIVRYAQGFGARYLLLPSGSALIPLLKSDPSFSVLSDNTVSTLFEIND